MVVITRSSSSGLWQGETFEEFDTAADAQDWLKAKADRLERDGYDVTLGTQSLEVTADWRADADFYRIVSVPLCVCGSRFDSFQKLERHEEHCETFRNEG